MFRRVVVLTMLFCLASLSSRDAVADMSPLPAFDLPSTTLPSIIGECRLPPHRCIPSEPPPVCRSGPAVTVASAPELRIVARTKTCYRWGTNTISSRSSMFRMAAHDCPDCYLAFDHINVLDGEISAWYYSSRNSGTPIFEAKFSGGAASLNIGHGTLRTYYLNPKLCDKFSGGVCRTVEGAIFVVQNNRNFRRLSSLAELREAEGIDCARSAEGVIECRDSRGTPLRHGVAVAR